MSGKAPGRPIETSPDSSEWRRRTCRGADRLADDRGVEQFTSTLTGPDVWDESDEENPPKIETLHASDQTEEQVPTGENYLATGLLFRLAQESERWIDYLDPQKITCLTRLSKTDFNNLPQITKNPFLDLSKEKAQYSLSDAQQKMIEQSIESLREMRTQLLCAHPILVTSDALLKECGYRRWRLGATRTVVSMRELMRLQQQRGSVELSPKRELMFEQFSQEYYEAVYQLIEEVVALPEESRNNSKCLESYRSKLDQLHNFYFAQGKEAEREQVAEQQLLHTFGVHVVNRDSNHGTSTAAAAATIAAAARVQHAQQTSNHSAPKSFHVVPRVVATQQQSQHSFRATPVQSYSVPYQALSASTIALLVAAAAYELYLHQSWSLGSSHSL